MSSLQAQCSSSSTDTLPFPQPHPKKEIVNNQKVLFVNGIPVLFEAHDLFISDANQGTDWTPSERTGPYLPPNRKPDETTDYAWIWYTYDPVTGRKIGQHIVPKQERVPGEDDQDR